VRSLTPCDAERRPVESHSHGAPRVASRGCGRDDGIVNDALRTELLARAGRDQAARKSLSRDFDMQQWDQTVEPVDRANTARLREILAEHGWPGNQLVGVEAAHAAWLLAQHAPSDLQEECLPLLEDAVSRDDASRRDLAYLMDRVLMHRGQPQVYGTQYLEKDGILTLWTVQEPGGLDQRRAALGLEPEAQNRARLLAAGKAAASDRDEPPAEDGGIRPGVPAP
jgi:hypothetical protein